jgi:hypothetical protein
MAMKVVFDARDRREAHWRGLRAEAGVRIEDIDFGIWLSCYRGSREESANPVGSWLPDWQITINLVM